jgi:hypothetical protein
MFYLKEFFKTLGESAIRGFAFFFFSCLLAFSLTHRFWIAKTIEQISPEKIAHPYFVAVVDNSLNFQSLKKSVSHLPGVLSFQEKDHEAQKSQLFSLVAQLGQDYQVSPELMDFKSVRIVLNSRLSQESLSFVRDQVIKIGGKDHLTASEVKFPEMTNMMKSHPFYRFLNSSGDWGIIGIIALCWIISYWLCYDIFRSRSYVIEKFQRKKLVAAKSLATGLAIVVLGFLAVGFWNGTLKFFDTVLLFMVFSVFWTFSMQEWRWKPTL